MTGLRPDLRVDEHVTLTGPDPLALIIGSAPNRKSREQQTGS